ncbi:hypothetical protein U8335_01485 [Roseiconus lacunae]|uniref:hypothetical protein n=1 Tax=Roseiconus lacunae TaxID=2605694 RepID=UPI003087F0FC|nr:hypothetical protein U8335_01485 [Stieleria sp. HD01]
MNAPYPTYAGHRRQVFGVIGGLIWSLLAGGLAAQEIESDRILINAIAETSPPLVQPTGLHDVSCSSCCDAGLSVSLTDPPGTLVRRLPYDAMQMDYYHRPYHGYDVPAHYAASSPHRTESITPEKPAIKNPYRTSQLETIYRSVESKVLRSEARSVRRAAAETVAERLQKDRPLEFVDWKAHEQARLQWEASHSQRPLEVEAFRNLVDQEINTRGRKSLSELILGTAVEFRPIHRDNE